MGVENTFTSLASPDILGNALSPLGRSSNLSAAYMAPESGSTCPLPHVT